MSNPRDALRRGQEELVKQIQNKQTQGLRAENEKLKRIINMAGGSPPPGILQFTDILLPLEAENERLKEHLEIMQRNLRAGAVSLSWISQYIDKTLKGK